jgi:hypothetical protein
MGRPRIYANDAERQRAFRARRRQSAAHAEPDSALKPTSDDGSAPVSKDDETVAEAAPRGNDEDATGPAVWEIFAEIWGSLPEQEFERLPSDGALEHDHYIYGTPKRYR